MRRSTTASSTATSRAASSPTWPRSWKSPRCCSTEHCGEPSRRIVGPPLLLARRADDRDRLRRRAGGQ
ncbi:hypothetical protein ACFPRL_16875 [Pseudoclavibacter helvolus]